MPDVHTAQGPVDAGELGLVLVHEHVRFRDEAVAAGWPDRYDEQGESQAALEADAPGVTEHVEKIHRAVARASVQTGAPIMAHSMPAVGTGPRQVDIFESEGVDLSRVQVAHCGDTDDVAYIEGLIERGVYVGLDRYGLEMFLPIDKRNATTAELLRRGHAQRLMISQDYCATIDWFPPEAEQVFESQGAIRKWSMTLVFEEVIPALREQKVMDDEAFNTIFVENPRRWLTA